MIRSAFRRLSAVSCVACWGWTGMVALLPAMAAGLTPTGESRRPQAAPPTLAALGGAPLCFEAPPAGEPTRYVARGRNYQFLVEPTGVEFVLRQEPEAVAGQRALRQWEAPRPSAVRSVRLQFVGANAQAALRGQEKLAGKVNYLLGQDPARWQVNLATFAQVQAREVYPGIDVLYYGNQRQLEYDFQVAPGANPSVIGLRFEGVDRLSINAQGELVLGVGGERTAPAPAGTLSSD